MKGLSTEIFIIPEVDAFHCDGKQYSNLRIGEHVRALAVSEAVLRYKMGNL